MTAQNSRTSRLRYRRLLAATVAAGVWSACLAGLVPTVASADDVQSQQWYLGQMRTEEMWKVSQGEGVKVAVVDSGVDSSTPALRGQVLPGKDMAGSSGGETKDKSGHGTNMAELIAGSGKEGSIKGIAPKAKILPVKGRVDVDEDTGQYLMFEPGRAIRAAADSDARIISM